MVHIHSEQTLAATMRRLQYKDKSITDLSFVPKKYPTKLLEEFVQTLETYDSTHLKSLSVECTSSTSTYSNDTKECAVQVLRFNLKFLEKIMMLCCKGVIFYDIMETLSFKTNIKHLCLMNCGIDQKGATTIAKYLHSADVSLEKLDLQNNENFGDWGLAAIMSALLEHTSIKTLKLAGCGITKNGMEFMSEILKADRCAIQNLNLNRNRIGDEGCVLLMEALSNSKSIHKLSFSRCNIGDDGTKAIGMALQSNQGAFLESLSLWGNERIGLEGFTSLANALAQNSSLHELDLGYCMVGEEACVAIMNSLSQNSSIKTLEIDGKDISKPLADFLQSNAGSIERLHLDGEISDEEAWVEIVKALAHNTHLKALCAFPGTSSERVFSSERAFRAVDDALCHNFVLQIFWCYCHADLKEREQTIEKKLAVNRELGPVKSEIFRTGLFPYRILRSLTTSCCLVEALCKVTSLGCLSGVFDFARERPSLFDLVNVEDPPPK